MTTRPEKTFRAGAISASIWNNINQTKEGVNAEYKSVSFERSYKDKNGTWQTTNSLRLNDLPKAQVVLNEAFRYLVLNSQTMDSAYEEVTIA